MIGLSTYMHNCIDFEHPLTVLYQLVVASINQGFYCYRVGVLTKSKCAVVLISMVGGNCHIIQKYASQWQCFESSLWRNLQR